METKTNKKSKQQVKKPKPNGKFRMSHPPVPCVTGQGGYFTDALKAVGNAAKSLVPKGAFSQLGQAGGNVFGPLGGKIGALLGGKIADVAGFGAYTVSQNSLMARVDEGVEVPQFENAMHATIVRHREYIQDISASGTTFTNLSFAINPALASSFPWLANLAANYDAYQVLGMIFEFKTLSSDITSGGALGSVILSTDYDVDDAAFTSKTQMENSEYCVSVKPSLSCLHAIECDPKVTFSPVKFTRSSAVPSGKDPRLYDWGNFQIATNGLPTSSGVIGELWVSYEVALYKPSLEATLYPAASADHFALSTSITTSNYLTATTTTVASPTSGSTLKGTISNSTYSFPTSVSSGLFLFCYSVVGASTTLTNAMSFNASPNGSADEYFAGGSLSYNRVAAGATATVQEIYFTVSVSSSPCTVVVSSGTLPGTITSGDLIVVQLPSTS